MRVFARWVKRPLKVSVQCTHDADAREHCRAAGRRDQDQRFHRRLPLWRLMLGLRKLCDVIAGILEGDELAAARAVALLLNLGQALPQALKLQTNLRLHRGL